MMRNLVSAVFAALSLFALNTPASAESIDASAFSCKELTDALNSADESDQYGATVLLYWMHGYLATEEQGTVVDFDQALKAFERTAEFCAQNPNIGVMTASQKYMGENLAAAGKDAIDLSVIKCEKVINSDKDDAQGLGQIMMWLAGYHASYDENTVIDLDKFDTDTNKIGSYCGENLQVGFYTASEKFMNSSDE
jgi:hypothetical protein